MVYDLITANNLWLVGTGIFTDHCTETTFSLFSYFLQTKDVKKGKLAEKCS